MPFCPKCRAEYEAGVARCSDCDESLVAELPPFDNEFSGAEHENWKCVANLTSTSYAQMIEEALREANIPVVVLSQSGYFGTSGMMGTALFNPAGAGYNVMIPADRIAEADAIATEMFGEIWTKARVPVE
ncbi:MAG: DUF2007 domain-containing protein [Candidatus Zixiibacteriota bacterium]